MTIDQQGSRRVGDRVDRLLADLAPFVAAVERAPRVIRAFERTVGDEVQAVVDSAEVVVEIALHVLRLGGWSVGIGAGVVDHPLPVTSRAGSGPAFVHARDAVEAAKTRSHAVPLAVRGHVAAPAAEAEGVLTLIGAIAARRSAAGWAVIDVLLADGTGEGAVRQEDVAARLGITQQAVSQRLRTALWAEERAARPAAVRLLRLAAGSADAPAPAVPADAHNDEVVA